VNKIKLLGALTAAAIMSVAGEAQATTFTLRIGSGHPAGPVTYVRVLKDYFEPEVVRRVAAETKYKIRFIEAYGGTIAKVTDVLEATQRGILDIGAMCFCFEPTKAFAQNIDYYVPFTTPSAVLQLKVMKQLYADHPELADSFSAKYGQTLIAISGYDNYNLGTNFPWKNISDLAGHKLGGAGPNLAWLEGIGATVVQTNINDMYAGVATGVFEGMLMFPGSYFAFKFHEVAPYYKVIDIGSPVVNGITINNKTMSRLPPEVVKIIKEVAAGYETETAKTLDEENSAGLEKLKAAGAHISVLPNEQRQEWARRLINLPNQMAKKMSAQGVDGPAIMRDYIRLLKKNGYSLPVEYKID
jgi:C4-dicarboxylate-binding protein DctP